MTVPKLVKLKGQRKIVSITAYDFLFARIVDNAGFDFVLVGDSVGTTYQGCSTTLPVTMEEMLYHTRIVRRGVKNALLVGDMPFLSYQTSVSDAIRNAGLFLKEGAEAVKLEGGVAVKDIVKKLVSFGIPVMGHVGLTPQSINVLGGYKIQGKGEASIKRLKEDVEALVDAGVFAIVLEGVYEDVAKEITESIPVPTIGIGAGRFCDGQILVITDILGLDPTFTPRFVKKYRDLYNEVLQALLTYKEDVLKGKFPEDVHSFKRKEE